MLKVLFQAEFHSYAAQKEKNYLYLEKIVFTMIHPQLAGKFYEEDFGSLNKQIEECFVKTTGDLPAKRRDVALKGVLVPHSSYFLAGKCYAWAYRELAESTMPERIVIIAPDNKGLYAAPTTCKDSWSMPFGVVKVDGAFINDLQEKYPSLLQEPMQEYAVEVQLPFLQYAYRDRLSDLKIVPLVIPAIVDFQKFAEAISDIDEKSLILVAANLTRFGVDHGSVPFKWNIKENIYMQDQNALDSMVSLDALAFLQQCKKLRMNMIGISAIATALETMKLLFATKGRLLNYYTSADITGDYNNAVGFASAVFQ